MSRAGATLLLLLMTVPAAAQTVADRRPVRRPEISIGAGLFGGADLGERSADLRANSSPPSPFRLFTTDVRLAQSPTFEARAGYALTRRYAVDVRFAFGRPELRAAVASDAEGAAPVTAVEKVDEYIIDASALVMLDGLRLGGLVPFAAAGAGYLRQLHEGQTLIEEGHVYSVGGGVKYWFTARDRGWLRATGVRADARLYLLLGGIEVDEGARRHGAISGSFFLTF